MISTFTSGSVVLTADMLLDDGLDSIGEQLYRLLSPLAALDGGDESRDWALLHFCVAVGVPFQDVADVVYDQADGTPGWGLVMDVDRCPTWALGWLAQFRGVRLPPMAPTETEGDYWLAMRDRIKRTDGQNRGSVDALRAAAERHLTGSKYVLINERVGADAYALAIRTFTTETPSPTLTEAAIREQKPAGIVLDYQAIAPTPTYGLIAAAFDQYSNLLPHYVDYADMAVRMP